MSLLDLEDRLRRALHADANRIEGRYAHRPALRAVEYSHRRRARRGSPLWTPIGMRISAVAAIGLLGVLLVIAGSRPRPAVQETPPMLVFDSFRAPLVKPLLARLAAHAAQLTVMALRRGDYTYFEHESWDLSVAVDGREVSSTVTPTLTETWVARTGGGVSLQRSGVPLSPGPLTSVEESAAAHARAVGPTTRESLSAHTTALYGHLSALSQNPRTLFTQLADPGDYSARYPALWPTAMSSPTAVAHAVTTPLQLLDYHAPTPKFLSTFYRMLMLVPGVSDAGWVTDRAGRRGIAIAVAVGVRGNRASIRFIVDPNTGQLLDVERIQLDRLLVRITPPYVQSYDVFLKAAVVARIGSRP